MLLSFTAFVSLGLPDGLLGVVWPQVSRSFQVPLSVLPVIQVAMVLGFQVASLSAYRLSRRLGIGRMLALCALVSAASLALQTAAPAFVFFVLVSTGLGLGGGAIDASMNAYAARHYSPSLLNWLHAFYGVGAALGPFVASAILAAGYGWRASLLTVAAALSLFALFFARRRHHWDEPEALSTVVADPTVPSDDLGGTAAESKVPLREHLGLLVFLVYTGVEVSLGVWGFSYYHLGLGEPEVATASAAGMYWFGLTIGRMAFAIVLAYVRPGIILYTGLSALVLTIAAMVLVPGAPALLMLPLCGLFLAPIFPLLVKATDGRVAPNLVAKIVGRQIAAANLGSVIVPLIGGAIVAVSGAAGLLWLFVGSTAVLVVAIATIVRRPGSA